MNAVPNDKIRLGPFLNLLEYHLNIIPQADFKGSGSEASAASPDTGASCNLLKLQINVPSSTWSLSDVVTNSLCTWNRPLMGLRIADRSADFRLLSTQKACLVYMSSTFVVVTAFLRSACCFLWRSVPHLRRPGGVKSTDFCQGAAASKPLTSPSLSTAGPQC